MTWHSILLRMTAMAPIEAAVVIIAIPTALVVGATILTRRLVGYENLATNNELAGVKFGVVALTYIMILTFATLSAWEKFSVAQAAVTEEAAAAGAIHIIAGSETKEGEALRAGVKAYLARAISSEWPSMGAEQADPGTSKALKRLYELGVDFDRVASETTQLAAEVFKHIDKINDCRQTRITLSAGIIPDLMWFILIFGAMLTISFTLFFGGRNIVPQAIMTGITTAILLMALLVIISFDHPFTGVVHVDSSPLQNAMSEMDE